ncbi:protein lines [Agrilus planipennis]|uniref:Protein lines n=1 Tax=Agrilus planipennis TaxID=224129 RepID=A0A1W4XJG9_AGRPL|nr:protein lines [Agrilus planipennis]
MVLRHREFKMASEQPVKKRLKRTNNIRSEDEPDYIHNLAENGMRNELSALHLSMPSDINEINRQTISTQFHSENNVNVRTTDSEIIRTNGTDDTRFISQASNCANMSLEPAPNIVIRKEKSESCLSSYNSSSAGECNSLICNSSSSYSGLIDNSCHVSSANFPWTNYTNCNISHDNQNNINSSHNSKNSFLISEIVDSKGESNNLNNLKDPSSSRVEVEGNTEDIFSMFRNALVEQCLCDIPNSFLQKILDSLYQNKLNGTKMITLETLAIDKILQFLSHVDLLLSVYLKQNNQGMICSAVVNVCDLFIRNEYNLIQQIIALCELRNKYVNYAAAKVVSSFLIVAKTNIDNLWLESIMGYLQLNSMDYKNINFALEIIRRVVEWKDVDIHILDESQVKADGASTSQTTSNASSKCSKVQYVDAESYDTSSIKGLLIKQLESKWPNLISKIQYLIMNNNSVEAQTCIISFLMLWESTISVRANLSVIDIKPFYAHLENFVNLLNNSLPCIIWKQLLSLFNEVLCYGSTLALQDMLPDDTCQLAHLIVRYVKDFRLLDSLPYRCRDGYVVHSFVGTIASSGGTTTSTAIDRTLIQKIILLVLKSVAVTIKETRSDSSDSSVGSDDYDFYQDMQLIERSIRDVLKKVDIFTKSSLDYHPETPFSKLLVNVFSDQDDYMIESMVCLLDITVGISYRNAVFPDLANMLNPVNSFLEFLKVVSHDSDVLLDYLVSNETCFLLYLLRFLKYIRKNWSKFVHSCDSSSALSRTNELDSTMTVLIRLKIQINRLVSRDLFPYNISPILKLLEYCEGLYEGNEYS